MKKLLLVLLSATLTYASMLPAVTLDGDLGGRVDGKKWSSEEIKGKVYVLFYVDPDEKEMNDHVGDALKKEKFDLNNYGSIAVINMAATWLPNFAIASSLEEKQKKFPTTTYVKDLDKVLVKKWNLKDDSSNVLLFDKSGKMIFNESGKLSSEKIASLIGLIKKNINL